MSARNFENIAENDLAKRNCFNIGFTTEVPYYMRLADLLIDKPGPGVIAEAVHCNLPALVDVSKNSVFPQERDVLEWIDEVDIGTFFRSLSDFKRKISSIGIEDLTRRKEKTASIHNNALFEAAVVIEMGLPKTPVIRPKRWRGLLVILFLRRTTRAIANLAG